MIALNKKQVRSFAAVKVGQFFKRKRIELGLTTHFVSKEIGLESASFLCEYESGESKIPLHHIFSLSNCLGLDPDEVLGFFYEITLG